MRRKRKTEWQWHTEIKAAQDSEMDCIAAEEMVWAVPHEPDANKFIAILSADHKVCRKVGADLHMLCHFNREIVKLEWVTEGKQFGGFKIGCWKGKTPSVSGKRDQEFLVMPEFGAGV